MPCAKQCHWAADRGNNNLTTWEQQGAILSNILLLTHDDGNTVAIVPPLTRPMCCAGVGVDPWPVPSAAASH